MLFFFFDNHDGRLVGKIVVYFMMDRFGGNLEHCVCGSISLICVVFDSFGVCYHMLFSMFYVVDVTVPCMYVLHFFRISCHVFFIFIFLSVASLICFS